MGALTAEETNTLKLYTSLDDEIWYIASEGVPTPSGYEYGEFCKKPKLINKKSRVRLVGSSRNSKLVCKLFKLKDAGDISELEVCSPQVEKVNLDEYSPEKVLMNMRKWNYPSSLGGFHKVAADDFIIHSLAEAFKKDANDEDAVGLFEAHPVCHFLKFIPFLNKKACAHVVAMIIDPRWYVDLNAPNKLANLFEYMGLGSLKTPNDLVELANPNLNYSKLERRHGTLSAWRNDLNLEKDFKSNFLIRTYSKVRETFLPGKTKKGEIAFDEADLATSQKFLSFIHAMWLNWLYHTPNPWNESLFVPEYFFSSKEEVDRFKTFFSKKA